MPSTVADIFTAAGASSAGVVCWATRPARPAPSPRSSLTADALDAQSPATGIYVVALTDDQHSLDAPVAGTGATGDPAPISRSAVDELLAVRPELTLDGARPTPQQLAARLAEFWWPDEVVVYIGLAGPRAKAPRAGELANRVAEYYSTPLGANGPHAGGWPLKTLACLSELYVHYAYCDEVNKAEDACIGHFARHVSAETLAGLRDRVRVMPFANLEFPKGNAKNHGIRGARAPKRKRTAGATTTRRAAHGAVPEASAATAAAATADANAGAPTSVHPSAAPAARATPHAPSPGSRAGAGASTSTPHHRSLRVTAKDIAAGQVRIGRGATKTILPRESAPVRVRLHGRDLGECLWNPRYGPDKERSGILRVGRAAARELITPEEVLAVSVDAAGVVELRSS